MNIEIVSNISAVTVYPDRARVTRVGECEITTGLHRLLFTDLPLSIDQSSVRVVGQGTAELRILSVDVVPRFYEETPSEKVRELEAQIEGINEELAILKDRESVLEMQGKHLSGLWLATEEYAKGLSRGRSTVAEQAKLVAYLREQDEQVTAAKREIEQTKRPLMRKLVKLQQELKQLQNTRPRRRFEAQVEVEALTEGTFHPSLSYVVNSAGWQPLYDIRLVDEDTTLLLSYIAQVSQNSGEDWSAVALTVSTARPALNQRLPDLRPWYVDVFRPLPPPKPQVRSAKMAMAAPAMARDEAEESESYTMIDAMAVEPEPLAEAAIATAAVEAHGTAVSFKVGGSTDIPSDGSPHKTTMAQYNFKPEIDYVAIPKHTDAVFRRVKVTNESDSPLLAGSVNLFVQDEYIGKNQLEYTAVGGELELLLGVEERLTIGRELVKREVDKRFLSDKRRLRYGYEITIENLLESKVNVTLQDHIPVSRHEEIKISLQE
ncbi:MAG: mucoidy inhibitor MuiA family protein, partial [Anaerolineales bacterium]|nr:mucoidy inhibitor MuiA family protein [Anaerolineales bacterium]